MKITRAAQFEVCPRLSAGIAVLATAFAIAPVCLPATFSLSPGRHISLVAPAWAAQSGDERLAKLEVKFFKHTFPKDDDGVRLDRLEKMIFGEAKTGNNADRLKTLADTVPNLSSIKVADDGTEAVDASASSGTSSSSSSSSGYSGASGSSSSNSSAGSSRRGYEDSQNQGRAADSPKPGGQMLQGESKYPAVTALEQSIFKRDYASDPVGDRLNRLETKVFGHPSKFTDLSDRVDALKDKLKVDLANSRPPGSDWIDEEDDDMPQQAQSQSPRRSEPVARSDGDDGRSFSGRDLRKDMQRAFGAAAGGSYGSGSYGSGGYGAGPSSYGSGASGSASGAYGMGSGGGGRAPGASRRSSYSGDDDDNIGSSPATGVLGLSAQVSALETAVLGKTYSEPLINRVARLEDAVFQGKAQANASLSLPERVAKLTQKVPVSATPPKTASRSRRHSDDDFDDDDDMGMSLGSGMGGMGSGIAGGGMTQTTKGPGGLSRIINSIGNALGGGYTTSYSISGNGGGLMRDPSTGYLVDTSTGNLINPSTGMVMGRATGYGGYGVGGGLGGLTTGLTTGTPLGYSGYGNPYAGGYGYGGAYPNMVNPMGGFNSFNNGFSPYGYGGYGYPGMVRPGINFGTGGFGIRF